MYYTVGDASYFYEQIGEGIPIVLLHGFTGTSSTWSSFIENSLNAGNEWRIITVDLPGHGKTITKTSRTMEGLCSDLAALFKSLNLTSFYLLGYSMGGRIALSFAMIYPEMVRMLIMESSSPGLVLEEERKNRIKSDEKLAQKIENQGITAFVNEWEDSPLFATQKKLPTSVQKRIRQERLNQSEKGLVQALHMLGTGAQPSWWDQLHEFKKPVLLITGEFDNKFIKINEQMEKRFPDASLINIEKSGHAIHVEQPQKFDRLINESIFYTETFTYRTLKGGYL